jgi:TIR domain
MAQGDVFVSYSQPDHDVAHELVARAESNGIQCWIAPRDVPPGESWPAAIIGAINNTRVMVLVFSAAANSSPQVCREVERAINRGVRVLPFRIADVVPTADLEFFLSSRNWLNAFPPPLDPHYAQLCVCLKTMLANPTNTLRPEEPAVRVQSELQPGALRPRLLVEPAHLRRLETELAFYIGPIAEWVVRCAAPQAQNVEALLRHLGAEIASETQRQKFIQGCHQWLHAAGLDR